MVISEPRKFEMLSKCQLKLEYHFIEQDVSSYRRKVLSQLYPQKLNVAHFRNINLQT